MANQLPRLPSQLTYNDLNGSEATEILVDWFRQLLRSNPQMQPHLTLPMAKFTLDVVVGIDMYVGGTVPVASPPEHMDITGVVTLDNSVAGGPVPSMCADRAPRLERVDERRLTGVINAAPIEGGRVPDEIRTSHDLPVPGPGYGPRSTGSHMFLSDIPDTDTTGGRHGEVAPGYTFSEQIVKPGVISAESLEQHIPVDNGEIHAEYRGDGIRHESGMTVKAPTHRASVKELGDGKGQPYSSVNAVYDAGPRGLMNGRHSGGLYSDGRPRIVFGNQHGGSGR